MKIELIETNGWFNTWKVIVDEVHMYYVRDDDSTDDWVLYGEETCITIWVSPYDARSCKDNPSTKLKQVVNHIDKWWKIKTL